STRSGRRGSRRVALARRAGPPITVARRSHDLASAYVLGSMLYCTIESPVGELLLAGDGEALAVLHLQHGRRATRIEPGWTRNDDAFARVHAQLDEYFGGRRRSFDVTLKPAGSPFELAVWRALLEIPYGDTVSYGEL